MKYARTNLTISVYSELVYSGGQPRISPGLPKARLDISAARFVFCAVGKVPFCSESGKCYRRPISLQHDHEKEDSADEALVG